MADNEEMGGPKGYMDTMVSMYQGNMAASQQLRNMDNQFQQLRAYAFEFISENKLDDEWNEFLKTKEETKDDVQEQETEEVPQEEAESGEEVVEAPEESKKDKKE